MLHPPLLIATVTRFGSMLPPSINRFRSHLNAARPSGSPSGPLVHNSASLRAEARRPERPPVAGAGGRRSPFPPFKYSKNCQIPTIWSVFAL